jgi:uncharacterized protein
MKVAVVGTGIAGLGAAYLLMRHHDVEVFEQADRAGGHSNTISVPGRAGTQLGLDTGFIVHNETNYPNLVRLFAELGVPTQDSEMSFSVSCARCGLEYSGRGPWAQGTNLLRPGFLRLAREIARFLRTADQVTSHVHGDVTLSEFTRREGYSTHFRDHFLMPLTASIWSTAPDQALEFPAAFAIGFLRNHGMLGLRRFTWRTVTGGSRTYVDAIAARLGTRLHLRTPVTGVRRDLDGVDVQLASGTTRRFDAVVMAAHADQSLALLADPSDDEARILGAFGSTANETVLHSDTRMIPRRRGARAAWNYRIDDCRSPSSALTMTYDLNRLQDLRHERPYLVTLNCGADIAEHEVIERIVYHHPRVTFASLNAQRELPLISGARRTWFCGAWQGYGFHEDGLASAVRVARDFGVDW